jgi:hypothetical protein
MEAYPKALLAMVLTGTLNNSTVALTVSAHEGTTHTHTHERCERTQIECEEGSEIERLQPHMLRRQPQAGEGTHIVVSVVPEKKES